MCSTPNTGVKLGGEITFFLNSRGRLGELPSSGIILEFYLRARAAVDAKYNELIGFGYPSAHAPFVTSFGMYFAMINDPDRHTSLLSAD